MRLVCGVTNGSSFHLEIVFLLISYESDQKNEYIRENYEYNTKGVVSVCTIFMPNLSFNAKSLLFNHNEMTVLCHIATFIHERFEIPFILPEGTPITLISLIWCYFITNKVLQLIRHALEGV